MRIPVIVTADSGTPAHPTTQVKLVSEAQLSGLLAEFAKTGGVALTNAILAEFTRRFSAQFGSVTKSAQLIDAPPEALSAPSLALEMIRSFVRKVIRWVWRTRRD